MRKADGGLPGNVVFAMQLRGLNVSVYRVEITSEWKPEMASKEEVLVGYVSGVGGGRGVAFCEDQEVSFPSDMYGSLSSYRPHVNDWIKVGVARAELRQSLYSESTKWNLQ